MAITVDGSTLQSGVGSASFNGTSLNRIAYGSTTVWERPNCSYAKCCSYVTYDSNFRLFIGDDTVHDEIVICGYKTYTPDVSHVYELCVSVSGYFCYDVSEDEREIATYSRTFSLGCKTAAASDGRWTWDSGNSYLNVSPSNAKPDSPSDILSGSWNACLKLVNHTTGVASEWMPWQKNDNSQTKFYV